MGLPGLGYGYAHSHLIMGSFLPVTKAVSFEVIYSLQGEVLIQWRASLTYRVHAEISRWALNSLRTLQME